MKKKRLKMAAVSAAVLVFAALLGWNIYLHIQLQKYIPQIEVYLPEDIYVAVGCTVELYDDQVVWSGLEDGYSCNWDCEIGQNLSDRFSVTGTEEQVGDYPLTLTVYDYNVNEIETCESTLHVVEVLEEGYSITNIGDSLSNGTSWYRTIYHLSGDIITFTGTRGWENYSHEGRSGFTAMDYLNPTEYFSDGVSEGIQPFYDPVQEMFDWNYYKLYTGKDPDVIQIFLGTNGLSDDPSETVKAIAQMVDNIRRHDEDIPIYIVNTIYWGDQDIIGSMTKTDGTAYLQGQFKNRSDKRIMTLMKALAKKFKNTDGVTLIPLALMVDSGNNYDSDDALHPNEDGYQQFAEAMYSWYCGTLGG